MAQNKKMNKPATLKGGPLSNADRKFIEDYAQELDAVDMAQRLGKSLKVVDKYRKEYLANAPKIIAKRSESEEMRRELKSSAYWSTIKEQFTDKELVYFENAYIDYRLQMKDVTPVEIKQIHQLVTIDIFMNRHTLERKNIQDEIERLEKFLEREHKRDFGSLSDSEKMYLANCETQLAAHKAATASKTKEYKDLLDKHTDILKSLKSTRDQRIKSLDDRGKFMALLFELEVSDRRKEIGTMTALSQMAMQKEKERLSRPIKYADGTIDQPLLSSETNLADIE